MKRTILVLSLGASVVVGVAITYLVSTKEKPANTTPPSFSLANSIGMKFVLIPAGTFIMGSPPAHRPTDIDHPEEEGPQHEVEITRPFHCGIYEVTQGEYQRVMGTNPSWHTLDGFYLFQLFGKPKTTENLPVEKVSWHDAVEFCQKLSELPEEKRAGRVYRLPTEAEWEYACRAGTTTRFNFGDACNGTECRCNGRVPVGRKPKGKDNDDPAPVGSYPPNAWGLYDMHGNVEEWCSDWYGLDYYSRSPRQDPQGPESGTERIHRGGYYCAFPSIWVGSANRTHERPDDQSFFTGFRVVMTQSEAPPRAD